MKAAVWYGHKDIRVEDVPEPKIKDNMVKIKVAYAGICGTDKHEYLGPNFIPAQKPHRLTGRTAPLIMGHEFTGEIVEIGPGVKGWKIGERVSASGSLVCGQCDYCQIGKYNICEKLGFNGVSDDGAFAEYIVVPSYQLIRIPDEVSLRDAVLAEPLACGIHASKLIGDLKGKRIVIVGTGMIAVSCLIAAKAKGAESILVIGRNSKKTNLIKKIGAEFISTKEIDVVTYVKEWSENKMADVVFECVGTDSTLDLSIKTAKNAGIIMVMGVFEKKPIIDMNLLQEGEKIIMTSQAYVDEMIEALEYIKQGIVPCEDVITSEIALEEIVEKGFEEMVTNSSNHIKIIVKIS
ncbi:alcohol dehydrogenase catalytic domain-containing protein [Thermovenabulum gondwanense]|uniref:Sorbitol dehydrogenase n=1 Tax=Thermovenabulum gondwanense TaxID=520767 RepID=A0A162MCK7_9FIRM|nr:alcohol dehydrogenase catalytic domain-containing protein [Thermovenabulum gondwanense]KYO65256.1 Sorbitol dehydrogenase [Thermovenabulum gondwanense]